MNKNNDDELIIEMIAQAALEGDAPRAFYLHDCWMVEFTPEEKVELKMLYGADYERLFEVQEGLTQ